MKLVKNPSSYVPAAMEIAESLVGKMPEELDYVQAADQFAAVPRRQVALEWSDVLESGLDVGVPPAGRSRRWHNCTTIRWGRIGSVGRMR